MKTRLKIVLAGVFLGAILCMAQSASRSPSDRITCPEGKAVAEIDLVASPGSLDDLVHMSQLIVDGTVSSVLPAVNRDPSRMDTIETHLLISFGSTLYGTLPAGTNTIMIAQRSVKTPTCEASVYGDSLLNSGERYIFFLTEDPLRQPADTKDFPQGQSAGRDYSV